MIGTEDVRALVDLGFIALSAGLNRHARKIFEGVEAARPEGEAGPLGLALADMAEGDLDAAVARLRALPPSDAALTYLGLARARQGDRDEAARALRRVAAGDVDGPFAALAAAAIEEFRL
ncbi:hypothetical protein [Aureimonas leprariae]|uniref:Tetratricopeptide repeat protein n=1 Tax=Plantimonas leprariae TaxID=2615207 RepID=A0A7V7PLA9_9HYPH|nr:hypothetical protein [Aureimonas leprariae]KAB0676853.1 hypothetical protein F6X38_19985 [Aureimonas leprariae]